MASSPLTYRLPVLTESYKQTLNLIQELQRFPNSATFVNDPNPDEKRIDVANEIHQNLKEQEDSIEFLKQEIQDETPSQTRRQPSNHTEERERNAATISRLSEDLKSARTAFRRAQLQAKRNSDSAKLKERQELFADRLKAEQPIQRRDGQKKVTQDELALNAAEDVTKSLRRAHELLSGNLQQSEFAQQTLDESQEALKSLAESYGGTTDLLKSSRGLVSQLVRSTKSDSWFLMSSVYLLAATIAWLVFRRLLYGPLWWLVWQPLKLMWYFTFASLGAIGFGGQNSQTTDASSVSITARDIPTNSPGIEFRSVRLPAKGGGWGKSPQPPIPESPEMVEEVGKLADQADERLVLQERDPAASPSNSKKRMYEEGLRDEL